MLQKTTLFQQTPSIVNRSLSFSHIFFIVLFTAIINTTSYSQISQTFTYTGAVQTYTVPSTGLIQIETWGAQGGSGWISNANFGGYAKGTYSLSAGTVLRIYVGEKPAGVTGGFNGGGNGEGSGLGGGGATDVRVGGTAFANRIQVAGGAGGASYWSAQEIVGGYGGGLTGGDGYRNDLSNPGGAGGTQIGSGAGTCVSFSNAATSGGLGYGGSPSGCGCDGYGGGGGYYGGAGSGNCRGGGGGSGYFSSTATNTVFTNGVRANHGQAIITILFTANSSQNNISCNGSSNGSATITASGITGPYTYSWIPGGGTNSVAPGLSAGTYTCIVTAPGSTIYPVVTLVQPLVLGTGIASQTNVTCNGYSNGAATLSVTGGVAPYSYTWSPGGGNSLTANSLSAGTYTVNIKDANNCVVSQTLSVTQPAPVIIGASATSPTICNGGSTVLTGSNATTYTWTGGITNGSPFSPTITSTYSLTGNNALGCPSSNTAVVTITVHALPVISIASGSVCSGSSYTLTPSGANTYTYSSGSAVVSPTVATSYSITGTSAEGCLASSEVTVNITVVNLPTVSVNSGSVCSGQSFTIVASGANTYLYSSGNDIVTPLTNSSYSVTGIGPEGCLSMNTAISSVSVTASPVVTVNSGSVCQGQSFTITPSGANTYTFLEGSPVVTPSVNAAYTVTGTNAEGCVSAAAIASVAVNELPLIYIVSSGSVICAGEQASLTANGAGAYVWNTQETASGIVVTPLTNTDYTVAGTDVNGCANSAVITQSVSECTGLASVKANYIGVSVYPNPNNGSFTISTDTDLKLVLLNSLGQWIDTVVSNETNNHKPSVNNLSNGIYFLYAQVNNQVINQKIIVTK